MQQNMVIFYYVSRYGAMRKFQMFSPFYLHINFNWFTDIQILNTPVFDDKIYYIY